MVQQYRTPPLIWALMAVIIYEMAGSVGVYVPHVLPPVVQLIGIVLLMVTLIRSPYGKMDKSVRGVFTFFLFWNFMLVIRGSLIGNTPPGLTGLGSIVMRAITDRHAVFAYFVPLVAIMTLRMDSLYHMRKIGSFICVISLILVVLNWEAVFAGEVDLGESSLQSKSGDDLSIRLVSTYFFIALWLIMLLMYSYNYKLGKWAILMPVYMTIRLFSMVVGGGRGGSVLALLYILIFFLMIYKFPLSMTATSTRKSGKFKTRFIAVLLIVGFAFGFYYLFTYTDTFDFLLRRTFVNGVNGELVESNRDRFVTMQVNDFNRDIWSWVFGRGINGAYACPLSEYATNGLREWQEWGYLFFILKGGIPYLVMYVYLFIHAAYMGFKRSNNVFCKAMAFVCVCNLIGLATVTIPDVHAHYVIVWFCFSMLENRYVRSLSDEQIYLCFHNKKYGQSLSGLR